VGVGLIIIFLLQQVDLNNVHQERVKLYIVVVGDICLVNQTHKLNILVIFDTNELSYFELEVNAFVIMEVDLENV
jgi:hypothetical protein